MTYTNSGDLFRTAEEAYQEAKQRILSAADNVGTVRLTFWFGYAEPHIDIEYTNYPYEEKVKGVHLKDITEELIRRINFVRRQQALKLLAPIVDATATETVPIAPSPSPSPEDDEIPF